MDNDNKPVCRFDKSKSKEELDRRHIEKVIEGTAKVRDNKVRKFTDAFFAEDLGTVKSHLKDDLLIPEIKKLLVNLLKDGVEILFNGRVTRGVKQDRFSDNYAYNRCFDRRDDRRYESNKPLNQLDYRDILFETRGKAQAVLDTTYRDIRTYGFVCVSDMYEMVGLTAPFTGNNYGWMNIDNATIERVYNGYVIRLPRAVPIER